MAATSQQQPVDMKYSLTDIEIRMGFAASRVETAAKQAGCSYLEMYRRMKRVGLINNYILQHYEVIHTESRENITADILETLSRWEASRGITAPKDTNLYLPAFPRSRHRALFVWRPLCSG